MQHYLPVLYNNIHSILNNLGPNDHIIAQIKDAVRYGLRAVKNTIEDEAVVLVSFACLAFLSAFILQADSYPLLILVCSLHCTLLECLHRWSSTLF